MYSDNGVFIRDVEYKNKKYLEAEDATRAGKEEIYYNIANQLKKIDDSHANSYIYYLENEMGGRTIICGVKK